MKEQLVTFETAKLAKQKGFDWQTRDGYWSDGDFWESWDLYLSDHYVRRLNLEYTNDDEMKTLFSAPTQSLLQKFIREKRGVHIEVHRNASGYYWSMCKSDGGTDLGWSDGCGPNLGGVWDSYEDALEFAEQLQLSYDLPKDKKVILHWGNYVNFALQNYKKLKIN